VKRQRVLLLSLYIAMWWATTWTFTTQARAQTRDALKPLQDIGLTVARAVLSSSLWCNPALLRGGVYIRDSDDSEAG
jgi:hypothetical protein